MKWFAVVAVVVCTSCAGSPSTIDVTLPAARSGEIRYRQSDLWRALDSRRDMKPQKVEEILDSGVDPNFARDNGETPLHIAARWSSFGGATEFDLRIQARWRRVLMTLLEKGADPNYANATGRTPLHDAAIPSDGETMKLLLEKGADANTFDEEGRTPLHTVLSATRDNPSDTINVLLAYGADPYARSAEGRSTTEMIVQDAPGRAVRWAPLIERPANLDASGYRDAFANLPASILASLLALHDTVESNAEARKALLKRWRTREQSRELLEQAVHWEVVQYHAREPLRAARSLRVMQRRYSEAMVNTCRAIVREARPLQRPARHQRILVNEAIQYIAPFADREAVAQTLRDYVASRCWHTNGWWTPMSLSFHADSKDTRIPLPSERRATRKWTHQRSQANTIFLDLPRFVENYRGDTQLLIDLLDQIDSRDKLAADRLSSDGYTPTTLYADPNSGARTMHRRVLAQILAPNSELVTQLKERLDRFTAEDREFALELIRRAELQ